MSCIAISFCQDTQLYCIKMTLFHDDRYTTLYLTYHIYEHNFGVGIHGVVDFVVHNTGIVPYVRLLGIDDLNHWVSGSVGGLMRVREWAKRPEVMGVGFPYCHAAEGDAAPLLIDRPMRIQEDVCGFHRD